MDCKQSFLMSRDQFANFVSEWAQLWCADEQDALEFVRSLHEQVCAIAAHTFIKVYSPRSDKPKALIPQPDNDPVQQLLEHAEKDELMQNGTRHSIPDIVFSDGLNHLLQKTATSELQKESPMPNDVASEQSKQEQNSNQSSSPQKATKQHMPKQAKFVQEPVLPSSIQKQKPKQQQLLPPANIYLTASLEQRSNSTPPTLMIHSAPSKNIQRLQVSPSKRLYTSPEKAPDQRQLPRIRRVINQQQATSISSTIKENATPNQQFHHPHPSNLLHLPHLLPPFVFESPQQPPDFLHQYRSNTRMHHHHDESDSKSAKYLFHEMIINAEPVRKAPSGAIFQHYPRLIHHNQTAKLKGLHLHQHVTEEEQRKYLQIANGQHVVAIKNSKPSPSLPPLMHHSNNHVDVSQS